MTMKNKNTILIEKLKEHNIPLDGLSVKGAISKDRRQPSSQTDTEFVKKFKK